MAGGEDRGRRAKGGPRNGHEQRRARRDWCPGTTYACDSVEVCLPTDPFHSGHRKVAVKIGRVRQSRIIVDLYC